MAGTGKLDQLTGLRYVAALLVFLSHLEWPGSDPVLARTFESGFVGVSFFFVLSGFVLSYSYGDRITSGRITFAEYFLLRWARLTPLHVLTALPFVLLAVRKSEFDLAKTVLNLFYLQSWVPDSGYYFSLNAPSWSLSNEMFFYACFFPLVSLGLRGLFRGFTLLGVLIACSAAVVANFFPALHISGDKNLAHWLFYIFPGFRLIEFITGMLIFKAWRAGVPPPGGFVVPAYVLLGVAMFVARDLPESFRMSLFFLPLIAFFFFAHLDGAGWVGRILASRLLVLLGNASFAFYLIHQPLIGVLRKYTAGWNLPFVAFAGFTLVLITALSVAIYLLYERKLELLLRRWVTRRYAPTL